MNIAKFLRTPFLQNISGRLLLKTAHSAKYTDTHSHTHIKTRRGRYREKGKVEKEKALEYGTVLLLLTENLGVTLRGAINANKKCLEVVNLEIFIKSKWLICLALFIYLFFFT